MTAKTRPMNTKLTDEEHQRLKVAAALSGLTHREILLRGLEQVEQEINNPPDNPEDSKNSKN